MGLLMDGCTMKLPKDQLLTETTAPGGEEEEEKEAESFTSLDPWWDPSPI